jgi:glycosidase
MHSDQRQPLASALRRIARHLAATLVLQGLISHGAVADELRLHVPSPDWRDQVIYFVVTDRFNDGDPGNNNQGAGEYGPEEAGKYSGGDLRGLEQKLGYIQGLGATAVWITPPVANVWWSPSAGFSGHHGYWAENFLEVDRHLGGLDDYKHLSHALHSAGMYLVQDIVLNHTGDFFYYDGAWAAKDPGTHFRLNTDTRPGAAPTQWPFSMNDARNPEHRKAAIYHWTPNVTDYTNRHQELDFQMSGLDDLNTENPVVRAALRSSYGYWIKEVGVDAFRVDTAFYVPPALFDDFINATDPQAPGIALVARATGRNHFHLFGEGFGIDRAFETKQMRKIDRYMRDEKGHPLLPGMLNFPLYGAINDTFARGRPTAEMAHRIRTMMLLHANPHLMPSFLDNHDVDRFLKAGSEAGLKQGLLLMMTLPGIPVIYAGTEQGFRERQPAMFKNGFHSGGVDHFDVDAPLYQYLQRAIGLRRENKLFSRGTPEILRSNTGGPGALVYRVRHEKDEAIVAFNTADSEMLVDNLNTGLRQGATLAGLFAIDGLPGAIKAGPRGRITLTLPPRSAMVWKVDSASSNVKAEIARSAVPAPTIDTLRSFTVPGDFPVSGTAPAHSPIKIVIDGNLATAQDIGADARGHWRASIDTGRMASSTMVHTVVAWDAALGQASAGRSFRVERQWKLLASLDDPSGDDTGPGRRYAYPTDPGWGANRQLDIRKVQVYGAGGAMRVDLTMNRVTATWNPPNEFDHVAFTVFVGIPGRNDGSEFMPLQNATLPDDMRWHVRLRSHGWSNALFSSQGSGAHAEGNTATPSAEIRVDATHNRISFMLPSAAVGNLRSLSGVKLYINTWDYDDGYRALMQEAHGNNMGGGDGKIDPLIMDDIPVLTLP